MAEKAKLHLVLGEKHARDGLAPDYVFFPILERDMVQRGVAECVIAELKAIVDPHLQRFDTLVDFSGLVEFLLVDEAYHGNLLVAERTQEAS